MNIEQAKEIKRWLTSEPRTVKDFGTSYTVRQIAEAFTLLEVTPPQWVVDFQKELEVVKWIDKAATEFGLAAAGLLIENTQRILEGQDE